MGSSGLEPPTSRLSGVRSNHLSYEPISGYHRLSVISLSSRGGDEEDRTPDPLRARQVLSQLSYTPIFLRVSRFMPLLPLFSFLSSLQTVPLSVWILKIKQCIRLPYFYETSLLYFLSHIPGISDQSLKRFPLLYSIERR